jgi:hypothetical protein
MAKSTRAKASLSKKAPSKSITKNVSIVTEQPKPAQVSRLDTPAAMLAIAVEKGMDLAYIKELMGMYKEWLADKAKQEFNEAMADFQGDCPDILKTKRVSYDHKDGEGSTEYFHEELGLIIKEIKRPLAKYGLSKDWIVEEVGLDIQVTCVITHKGGHAKAGKPLKCPPDTSGKKNLIQAKISTISYLQRATLKAALGIAAIGEDDDGAGAAKVVKPFEMDILPIPGDEEFNAFLKSLSRGTADIDTAKQLYSFTEEQLHAIEIAMRKREEGGE